MNEMINWLSSSVTTPNPDRWLIVKDSTRLIFDQESESGCAVIRYSTDDTEEDIAEGLKDNGFDLWAYTDEGDHHD